MKSLKSENAVLKRALEMAVEKFLKLYYTGYEMTMYEGKFKEMVNASMDSFIKSAKGGK